MDATTRFESQIVGSLPVLTALLQKWGLAQIINDTIPWEGKVPLGSLIEVLLVNRVLQPRAMYGIGEWAKDAGVTDYFGLTVEQLNDDLFGRALERVAQHRDAAVAQATLAAVKEWQVDVSEFHCDISNVEFYGAFSKAVPADNGDPGEGPSPTTWPTVPCPAYGHTKSGRDDVKQIQFGISVSGDGAVPLTFQPLDGNTAEARTHVANLLSLRELFPKTNFLYTADTKLDTPENLTAIVATGGEFLCGGAFTQKLQEKFRSLLCPLRKIDYCPKSQERLPAAERDQYAGWEFTEKITGTFDGRNVNAKYRLIFIRSSAKAKQQADTRQRHIDKIEADFQFVRKNLGKYKLKSIAAITERLEKARGRYGEGKLFRYELKQGKGKFKLSWHMDEAELARVKAKEGVFVLKTNRPKKEWPLEKVLAKYRDQSKVEGRFHDMKGPLAVAPMFLKNPERIAGLLCVVVWAVTVLALMERAVRKNLKGKPLVGLYPEKRACANPTAAMMLRKFATLTIVIIKEHGTIQRRLSDLKPIQRQIVTLLGLDADVLNVFRRRCTGPPKNSAQGCGM